MKRKNRLVHTYTPRQRAGSSSSSTTSQSSGPAPPRKLNNVDIDDIDFIRRTLKCVDIKQPTSKSTEIDETEPNFEEEAQYDWSEPTSEYTRAQRLWQEFECLKKQIQLLQLEIKKRRNGDTTKAEIESNKEAKDESDLFSCSKLLNNEKNSDELTLTRIQKDQSLLQQQINSLLISLNAARDEFRALRKSSCQRSKLISQFELKAEDLMAWQREVSKESHVCGERYRYLENIKCTADKCVKMVKHFTRCGTEHAFKFLNLYQYEQSKKDFNSETEQIDEYLNDLHHYLGTRFSNIKTEMDSLIVLCDSLETSDEVLRGSVMGSNQPQHDYNTSEYLEEDNQMKISLSTEMSEYSETASFLNEFKEDSTTQLELLKKEWPLAPRIPNGTKNK